MFKLKTNTEVVIDPRTLATAFVFMHVKDILFNGQFYVGSIEYYWEREVDSGQVDPVTNDPIMTTVVTHLENSFSTFQVAEATAIENAVGTLSGNNLSEKFITLIHAGIMYQLMLTPVFGLNANGWSLVAQPN